jgi:hypothetical protein
VRTTVTLDPDVERLVREKARSSRQSFKQALNNAIRQGLGDEALAPTGKPFRVKARPMRLRPGVDPARLGEVADDLEIDAFLATTKRLRGRST